MFDIHFLPAAHGDCIWIEYGTRSEPHRILIDAGPGYKSSFKVLQGKLKSLPEDQRRFELFILSHIDADHIGGAIKLLTEQDLEVKFGDVWFNGWKHIQDFLFRDSGDIRDFFSLDAFGPHLVDRPPSPRGFLGAKQGEMFSTALRDNQIPWNRALDGRAVVVGDRLPRVTLQGGMTLTLLSPDRSKLRALRKRWDKEIRKLARNKGEDFEPGDENAFRQFLGSRKHRTTSTDVDALAASSFEPDSTAPNGSSIAVLAEYSGKRALLTGDAHVDVLEASIQALLTGAGKKLPVNVMKLSHHGSKHNTSADLLKLIDCTHYVVCSNGSQFQHPDHEAIGRVIKHGRGKPRISFNYRSEENEVWSKPELREKYEYRVSYPKAGGAGIVVKL